MDLGDLEKLVFGGDVVAVSCGGKEVFRVGVNGVVGLRRETVHIGRGVAGKPFSHVCLVASGCDGKYLGCVFPGPGVALKTR